MNHVNVQGQTPMTVAQMNKQEVAASMFSLVLFRVMYGDVLFWALLKGLLGSIFVLGFSSISKFLMTFGPCR